MLKRWLVRGIERYQAGGGGRRYFGIECNFEPTCSEYTRQAILDRGAIDGLRAGVGRIRRCTNRDQVGRVADPYPAERT